jgi:hypothetical protein
MAGILEPLFSTFRRRRVRPTESVGSPGVAIFGGYVVENEKSSILTDSERFRTFADILANTSIVGAGVRYFLNLCAKASWTFTPSDEDIDSKFAELAEEILTSDPETSWARIVRRAAMYRLYGFSVQEWVARRRDDGVMTLADVAPRAQVTIERWDLEQDGRVMGVMQRSPQTQEEIYLPREKLLYVVDDTLNDSPLGLGLFRHLVNPAKRLERYEQLEGFGFETDLRGIPVGKAPYGRLRQLVQAKQLTEAEARRAVAAIETFVERHVKRPDLGLMIDSAVYESLDAEATPSSQSQFDLKLLDGTSTSLPDMARSIERLNREMARILGVEAILLGDGDRGSMALSRDKTNQFSLVVDSTLDELADSFERDLLTTIWRLNGWPDEMMPEMQPEAVQYRDIEQIAAAVRDMADSGAPLTPDDPAVFDLRALMGLSPPDPIELEIAAQMRREGQMLALENPVPGDPGSGGPGRPTEGSVDDPEEEVPNNPRSRATA